MRKNLCSENPTPSRIRDDARTPICKGIFAKPYILHRIQSIREERKPPIREAIGYGRNGINLRQMRENPLASATLTERGIEFFKSLSP